MRILVLGDYISDVYTFGRAERLCPEAPVPVLIPEREYESDGGAALVRDQLRELGANTTAYFGSFSEKHRFFVNNHLMLRLDKDAEPTGGLNLNVEECAKEYGAFVISDYSKGAMTGKLADQIVSTGKPCFIDAKHHWEWFDCAENVWLFPNEHEHVPIDYPHVVRKCGAHGCRMGAIKLEATTKDVVDTTGAGDIFMAGFVYAWTLSFPAEDCLRFANALAGESCRHVGTYVVPQAFAQSVLDRLRSFQESQQRSRESLPDSMPEVPERVFQRLRDLQASTEAASGSLRANCGMAPIIFGADSCNLPPEQTPLVSPSIPTESSGTPALEGPGMPDEEGARWLQKPQSQNSTAYGHLCGSKRKQDQAPLPEKE